jgi:hypothetical protein
LELLLLLLILVCELRSPAEEECEAAGTRACERG